MPEPASPPPLPEGTAAPPADPMLPGEARGLVYEAGGARLIDGIDLHLAAGSRTVVMGANGAGKSVLLRLLHGLLTPSAGEVRWGGRRIDESIRARQAMVFQRPVLLRRSVQANVDFVLGLRGRAGRARTRQILERAGLSRQAALPARRLSGGEQQRLALARALALAPRVLFLDEPAASLDPAAVAAIEQIVNAFHEEGAKVVLVTHDLGQARRIADDVVFLHHGRLLEHSASAAFFDRPRSGTARDYLAGKLVL